MSSRMKDATSPPAGRALTAQQREACRASGNVLLMAGAGTGKTSTLIERCLGMLLREEDRISLEQMLVVTFTEAAAAEMRKRLRIALEEQIALAPHKQSLAEQRALLEIAQISTLHSFCLRLLREHFFELGLDPQLAVLLPPQAKVLEQRAIRSVFEPHYHESSPMCDQLLHWVGQRGEGRLGPLENSVLKVYRYAQALPGPEKWLREQRTFFQTPYPGEWEKWLRNAIGDCGQLWRPILERCAPESLLAAQAMPLLAPLSAASSREIIGRGLDRLLALKKEAGRQKKNGVGQQLDELFTDAEFLASVCQAGNGPDPLQADWDWVRPQILALIQLVEEFTQEFSRLKRERSGVDFSDLEQFTLRLLLADGQPTSLAREWQEKLQVVLVDEYQDINPAQDAILKAISREREGGNRFLVGDIKQSIYRFRLANPRIFQSYARTWNNGGGKVILLTENFRSHEVILNFVNAFFSAVMSIQLGGVEYTTETALRFGNASGRSESSAGLSPEPRVELELVVQSEDKHEQDRAGDLTDVEGEFLADDLTEPALIAARLRRLKASKFRVREGERDRPVEWRDLVVLQRSLADKTEAYARAFLEAGVPLIASPEGFYDRAEIQDLFNLLRILDNPIQDIPLLGVLASPLGGFAPKDLAEVRLTNKRISFWAALQIFHRAGPSDTPTSDRVNSPSSWDKACGFLRSFERWRRWSRQLSVSQCLERIIEETHYEDWLRTRRNGMQEIKNIHRFLHIAQQFDQSQNQGLLGFLQYLEVQEQGETEGATPGSLPENAVRLMTIHQAKGLEFPVVVLAGLGRDFNWQDLQGDFIIDEVLGICPRIVPPHLPQPYPSVAYWLAKKKQRLELLGEELRLLYVAMTRAQSLLILTGHLKNEKKLQELAIPDSSGLSWERLKKAKSSLEWVLLWVSHSLQTPDWVKQEEGAASLFSWKIHRQLEARAGMDRAAPKAENPTESKTTAIGDDFSNRLERLHERLAFAYPFTSAVRQPAKTSASRLRHDTAADHGESEWTHRRRPSPILTKSAGDGTLDAKDVGTAHHRFLELVQLDRMQSLPDLEQEVIRLQDGGALSLAERHSLNLPAIARFWQSAVGRKVQDRAELVKRELAFSCRFTPDELSALAPGFAVPLTDEFFIVQGVIDLAMIAPEEIWLLDFKTDGIVEKDLSQRLGMYEVQMVLYRQALQKIYGRPVTRQWLCFLELDRVVECTQSVKERGVHAASM